MPAEPKLRSSQDSTGHGRAYHAISQNRWCLGLYRYLKTLDLALFQDGVFLTRYESYLHRPPQNPQYISWLTYFVSTEIFVASILSASPYSELRPIIKQTRNFLNNISLASWFNALFDAISPASVAVIVHMCFLLPVMVSSISIMYLIVLVCRLTTHAPFGSHGRFWKASLVLLASVSCIGTVFHIVMWALIDCGVIPVDAPPASMGVAERTLVIACGFGTSIFPVAYLWYVLPRLITRVFRIPLTYAFLFSFWPLTLPLAFWYGTNRISSSLARKLDVPDKSIGIQFHSSSPCIKLTLRHCPNDCA